MNLIISDSIDKIRKNVFIIKKSKTKTEYGYLVEKGLYIEGTCETTCSNADISVTATGTSGTFCCSSRLCNRLTPSNDTCN